jgi:hypothetical protein
LRPDTFLGTHDQLKKPELPYHAFDNIFMAAAAVQEDNQEIDGILRCHPHQQFRMFLVIPPRLDAANEKDHGQAGAAGEAGDIALQSVTELSNIKKQGATNFAGHAAGPLLETGKSKPSTFSHKGASGQAQTVGMLEVEDALLHEYVEAVIEEASYVAIVPEDRGSFVHRSKVLLEHLVKVCVRFLQCDV